MNKTRAPARARKSAPSRLDLLSRLAEAEAPREVAAAIVRLMKEQAGCASAIVLWGLDAEGGTNTEPSTDLGNDQLDLVCQAIARAQNVLASDPRQAAFRLLDAPAAFLLLTTSEDALAVQVFEDASEPLVLAIRHLRRALQSEALRIEHEKLERSERLQRALFAISDLAGSDREMQEMMRGVHAIVGTLMYAENFFVVLHDPAADTLRFLYFADVEDPDPPSYNVDLPMNSMARSLTWYLLRDGRPLRGGTQDLRSQVSGPLAVIGPDSHDWLGVPLLRDGHAVGAIVVQSYSEGIGFTAADQTLLEFVGSHILIALERKLGKDELEQRVRLRTFELAEANQVLQLEIVERQRAERLQKALFQIAQLAAADISQVEFYREVHTAVGELMNARNFFIGLLTHDGESLEFVYFVDETGESYEARPLGFGASEYVLRHGAAILSREGMLEQVALGEIDLEDVGAISECWLGVPLSVGDETIGLIVVQSYHDSIVFGPTEQELLSFVASQVANSLQRRRSVEALRSSYAQLEERVAERTQDLSKEIEERERMQGQLKHQVMHDALTGLPNRSYLLDRIDRVLRRFKRDKARRCALLYLDVDRFKVINDSLGHLAGDTVLKEVARRLQLCVREPDIVGRLSGDEFAILLEDVPIPGAAIKIAQRVLDEIAAPLNVGGEVLEPSTSIGIAIGDFNYQFADDLVRDADTAMYRAKKLGRRRFVMYDDSLQENAVNVLAMEIKLRSALLLDQFEPHFQPVVRLATGEVVGYEALLRWKHPTRGVIGPIEFMQIAFDNGSIENIDWKMFDKTCKLASKLDPSKSAYIAINVSPLHFRRTDFDTRLVELVQRCGWPANRLVIELTEGSLIDHPAEVRSTLDRLRAAGIGAALDDFGTGHSSLSYLHTFPLRVLKIDRSFVSAIDRDARNSSAKIVAAVVAMARALEMDVVAEGIESEEQRDALVSLGCEFGQGYLLGRPAPVDHWMANA